MSCDTILAELIRTTSRKRTHMLILNSKTIDAEIERRKAWRATVKARLKLIQGGKKPEQKDVTENAAK